MQITAEISRIHYREFQTFFYEFSHPPAPQRLKNQQFKIQFQENNGITSSMTGRSTTESKQPQDKEINKTHTIKRPRTGGAFERSNQHRKANHRQTHERRPPRPTPTTETHPRSHTHRNGDGVTGTLTTKQGEAYVSTSQRDHIQHST